MHNGSLLTHINQPSCPWPSSQTCPFSSCLAEPAVSVPLLFDLFHLLIPMLLHLLPNKATHMEIAWFFTKNPENLTSTIRPTRRKFTKFNVIRKSGCAPYATNVSWVIIWSSLCKLCNALVFTLLFHYYHLSCYPNYRWGTFQSRNTYVGWSSSCLFGQDSNGNNSLLKYWPAKNFWRRYSRFLQYTRAEKLHSTWQCSVGMPELPWASCIGTSAQADFCCTAFHCSCVNNWYCVLAEGKAPNGHSESNKIFTFNANFTFKRFPSPTSELNFSQILR